jgi:hypothetical protein
VAGTHTELSQHIAGLLSALRAGDPLDPRSKAEELAAEYADLGVSAQMIEKAIFRAAEMVHLKIDMEACSRPPPPSEDAPEAAGEHRSEAVAEHPAEAFAEAAAEPHANGLFLVASVEVTGNAPPALQETLPAAEHEPAPIAPDEDFEFDLTDLLGSPPAGAAEAPPDESALPSLDEFEFQLQRAGIQLSDDEPDTAPLSLKSSAAAVRRMLFRS